MHDDVALGRDDVVRGDNDVRMVTDNGVMAI